MVAIEGSDKRKGTTNARSGNDHGGQRTGGAL